MKNHTPMQNFPLAMNAPESPLTYIRKEMIEEAILLSRESPRKRIILPFHKGPEDSLNRMINVIQPGSYIKPHSHIAENKAESIIVLQGGICYISFSETGEILDYQNLHANSLQFGVDSAPHIIHSFYALEEDTVLFEVKPGPYNKMADKNFASWAPEEYSQEAITFLERMISETQNTNP